jgi:hypothetical protein
MSAPQILNVAPNGDVAAPSITTAPPLNTAPINVPSVINSNTSVIMFKIPTTFYPVIGATYMVQMSLGMNVYWSTNPTSSATNALAIMYGAYNQSSNHNTIMQNVLASFTNTYGAGTSSSPLSSLYEFTLTALFSPTTTNNTTDGNQLRLVWMNNDTAGSIGTTAKYQVYNLSITQISPTTGTVITSANYTV